MDTNNTVSNTNNKQDSLLKKMTSYREFGLVLAFACILIIAAFITPDMYQTASLLAMLRNYSIYGILAVGMMAVLLTGGIDLSIGSTLAFCGILAANLSLAGFPVFVCILAAIGLGALCGLANGLLIGKVGILPLITTLASMYIVRGIAYIYSKGVWLMPHQFSQPYKDAAIGQALGIYNILSIYVVVLVLAWIFFSSIKMGRRIYAVGSCEASAKIAGINTGNVKVLAYLIMGIIAGLAGFLHTANYAMWTPDTGSGIEMEVIAICILGGVSITGGRGKTSGLIIATLMMSVISYFLSMLPGMSVWKMAIQGAIIIVAVAINLITARFAISRALKSRKI